MSYSFNVFTGNFDQDTGASGAVANQIQQLDADPASPSQEEAWVLKTTTGGNSAGNPIGLLLSLTYSADTGGSDTYQLKYRTKEDTTVGVSLS